VRDDDWHGLSLGSHRSSRGLAELYQNPDEAGQALLVGYAGPTEREYPAALEALAGTLRAVDF
jgi:hypothetical protein